MVKRTLGVLIFACIYFRELKRFAFREYLFSWMASFWKFREYLFLRMSSFRKFRDFSVYISDSCCEWSLEVEGCKFVPALNTCRSHPSETNFSSTTFFFFANIRTNDILIFTLLCQWRGCIKSALIWNLFWLKGFCVRNQIQIRMRHSNHNFVACVRFYVKHFKINFRKIKGRKHGE